MRISYVLALMVTGVLAAAGIASAQSTTTEPLSDYTTPVTTPKSTPKSTPKTTESQGSAPSGAGEVAADQTNAVAPAVAAQPAGNAPSQLAFTGAEPLLLIALGLALAGGTAFLLVRERRRS